MHSTQQPSSPEIIPPEKSSLRRRTQKIAVVIGLTAMAFLGSGDGIPELEIYRSPIEECTMDDGVFTIVDANIHYNYRFANSLVQNHNADIAAFQEVRHDDFKEIIDDTGCSEVAFGSADKNVQKFSGGQGNATVSVDLPASDHKIRRLYQGNFKFKKLGMDFLSASLSFSPGEYYKEGRLATAVTYGANIQGLTVPIRLINVHLDGDGVGKIQLKKLTGFINEQTADPNKINVVVGDFNKTIKQLSPTVANFHKIWKINDIGPTSEGGRQIDHAMFQPYVVIDGQTYLVIVESKTVDDKGSDHKAVVSTIKLKPIVSLRDFITSTDNKQ